MDQHKPVIGISTSRSSGWVLTAANRLAVWLAGGRGVVIKPGDPVDLARFDGFIIGGGEDLSPELYGGEVVIEAKLDPLRDELELQVLAEAARRDLPVLGICRGSQLINVAGGGTLYPDIETAFPDVRQKRYILPRKSVVVLADTLLANILGRGETLGVNAFHHQSVKKLGEGLRIAARDRNGIVQGIERASGTFMLGVQWHPELLLWRADQRRLFKALIDAARRFTETNARRRTASTAAA